MLDEVNQFEAGRYQLRYAAGIYWLLDTVQPGRPYREPIPMNELGADIWKMLSEGMNTEQILQGICKEYEADENIIRKDVENFLEQLKAQKIFVGKE